MQMLDAARAASGLLAVSRDLARQMAGMGMDAATITVHYTGLDRDRFRPLALRPERARETLRYAALCTPSHHRWEARRWRSLKQSRSKSAESEP